MRRLAAGAGALALASVGLAATAAFAAPIPGNIDPTHEGSITLFKHVDNVESAPGAILGDPLAGVGFTAQRVTNVDLNTAEGWQTLQAAEVTAPPTMGGLTLGADQLFPATDGTGMTTLTGLAIGAYYITEISPGGNLITAPAAPFLVAIPMPVDGGWDYDVVAYPKNVLGEFTPTKTVDDPANNMGLGQTVDWTIALTVPQSASGYNAFTIEDSLNPGLEFDSWVSISVGGAPLVPGTDYDVDAANTVTFIGAGLAALNSVTADEDALVSAVIRTMVTTVGVHENQATVTINGTPVDTDEPITNWGALTVNKVDSTGDSALDGAVFELYPVVGGGCDITGTPLATETTSGGSATFDFYIGKNEVKTMSVCVKETVAPQGYVLPADPVSGPFAIDAGSTATAEVPAATTVTQIANHKAVGPKLPLTGAQGTLMFTLIGAGLIGAGATIAFVRRSHLKA